MIIPNVEVYTDYSDFFRDFIQENKTVDSKYSHRYFASKLNWPDSLISDVISGRKTLTVSRCLQFSSFLDLNDFQTEYLIYLCLSKSNNSLVNKHFDETLRKRMNVSSLEYFQPKGLSDFSSDYISVAIFDYIRMTGRLTTFSEIVEALPTFRLDLSTVQACVDMMKRQDLVRVDEKNKVVAAIDHTLSFGLKLDKSKAKVLAVFDKSTENILSFLNEPVYGKFTVNTGFCIVNRTDIKEVEKRIIALRNWIASLEVNTLESPLEEKALFQYDFNLFPISKKIDNPDLD